MKKLILTFYFFVLSVFSLSQTENQDYNQAYPIIGWDSLRIIIERPENYPEIFRLAGLTGTVFLALSIDSTGILDSVLPYGDYLVKSKKR